MAVLAEIVRAGILSVDRGQSEAAYALGMRKWQVMTLVLVPQAVRRMLPVLIAQLVVLLKDTSLGLHRRLLRAAADGAQPGRVPSTSQFGTIYTFQLYVAAGADLHRRQRAALAAGQVRRGRTRRNKKAAATAEVELPADMQMGGGGGAVPPGSRRARRRGDGGTSAGGRGEH